MTFLRRAFLRLRAVFGRQKLNDDMQAEMREHLDRATERLIPAVGGPFPAGRDHHFARLAVMPKSRR